MQHKYIKYLLLLGVALIWGTVLYKVLNNTGKYPNTNNSLPKRFTFNNKDTNSYIPYNLLINYADPFGTDEKNHMPESSLGKSLNGIDIHQRTISNDKLKNDIDFIQYKGIITNSFTHKKAAIISVNGKDELARINKVVNNIKITAIEKGRIQVIYLDKKYWIKRL